MLAALAPATEKATLGTGALLPFLRRPIQAAQSVASVDLLSGGRLAVAVGAGFPGRFGRPFYALSEVPWQRRFTRLDETVALWRELWRGATSFHGEIVKFDNIPPVTLPFRAGGPPIWLGGATPAALARTGRLYDGWLPYPPDPADYNPVCWTYEKRRPRPDAPQTTSLPRCSCLYESTAASRAAAGRSMTMPTPTTACRWRSWRRSKRLSPAPPARHREPRPLHHGRSAARRRPPRCPRPSLPTRSTRAGRRPDPLAPPNERWRTPVIAALAHWAAGLACPSPSAAAAARQLYPAAPASHTGGPIWRPSVKRS